MKPDIDLTDTQAKKLRKYVDERLKSRRRWRDKLRPKFLKRLERG